MGSLPATDTSIDAVDANERSGALPSRIPPLMRITTTEDNTRPSNMTDSALTIWYKRVQA
jgi:hypothetical protein